MMHQFALWSLILLTLLPIPGTSAPVRTVEVRGDQIVQVKTAIGIATIIQVPDSPTSVVLGDLSAFKVEYLDQAITIKPLRSHAESNLYIHTDWKRFVVHLSTTSKTSADYIVYLKPKALDPPHQAQPIKWRSLPVTASNGSLELRIERLGRSQDGFLFVEFALSSKKAQTFDPASVWLRQKNAARPIQGLYLANLELGPEKSRKGLVSIRERDLDIAAGATLEIQCEKAIKIQLPKVNTWAR